ncbi:MAG: hypothetical protein IT160_10410 [Bryobacterales bacterium]|nr:hypothetical protein [Bryobacterales bacterium]
MAKARLIVVDPGHFHAALVQKDMYSWLSDQAAVYAPLTLELLDYLQRVTLFNFRKENPTRWQMEIHARPDFMQTMLTEPPGNVVVFAGHNRAKMDRIVASLEAGQHVLADKPWIIRSEDLGKLEKALDLARRKRLAAYDIMTERFEITAIVQRDLVNTPSVFGSMTKGSPEQPAVRARSIHNLMKLVAGVPIRRPPQFFDVLDSGEPLADVGTHVVDLVQWTVFPEKVLDYHKSVKILSGRRWPTVLSKAQFRQVTGMADYPASLAQWVRGDTLEYSGNNTLLYTVEGVAIGLEIRWDWQTVGGSGDLYEASFLGSKARVEIRQGEEENHRPEVYVVPVTREMRPEVLTALDGWVARAQAQWPGVALERRGADARITIPEKYRVGHEAHFAQVTNLFARYFADPSQMPAWEDSNMLLKYYVTTKGVEMGERG